MPTNPTAPAPSTGQAIQEAFAGKLEQTLAKIEGLGTPDGLLSIEDALRGFNDQQERLNALLQATPSADLERQRADIQLLAAAYEEGRLGAIGSTEAIATFTEAVQARLGTLPEVIKPATDAITEFTLQFQRNAQDLMGDTVLATLKGDFGSITKLWGNMLLGMASQAVAADLGNKLFPKEGPGFLSIIGGLFGFAKGGVFSGGAQVKAFANGGVVGGPTMFGMRGGLGLMGEAGPEAIMPLKRGRDGKLGVAGGGTQVVNHYNVSAGVSRNELMTALQLMQQQVEGRVYGTLRTRGVI
jgi:phage-related minor tail protein